MISVIGLIGAIRHHQVLLFFYMVVLFLIFLIQFSVSCAALAINEDDEKKIIEGAWKNSQVSLKPTQEDMKWSIDNHVFDNYKTAKCYHNPSMPINGSIPVPPGCQTCYSLISDKVNSGFNGAGGLGLFFSFSELIGGLVAYRYRNMLDP